MVGVRPDSSPSPQATLLGAMRSSLIATTLQPIDRTRIAYAAQAVPPERYETTVLANYGGEFGRDQHVFAQWLAQSFNAGDLVDGWSDQNTVTLARSAAGAA